MMNKYEAANYLGISVRSLQRYVRQGSVKVSYVRGRTGKTAVYAKDDLDGLNVHLSQAVSKFNTGRPRSSETSESCGKESIPRFFREAVFRRDGYACLACGGRESLSVDHVFPESKGGALTLDNAQTLCRLCNIKKGTRHIDFRRISQPFALVLPDGQVVSGGGFLATEFGGGC